MIKFANSYREYVQFKDCVKIDRDGCKVWVCPKCKEHKQEECSEYHDCKVIIYDDDLSPDGRLQGGNTQCCCYSKEHGKR